MVTVVGRISEGRLAVFVRPVCSGPNGKQGADRLPVALARCMPQGRIDLRGHAALARPLRVKLRQQRGLARFSSCPQAALRLQLLLQRILLRRGRRPLGVELRLESGGALLGRLQGRRPVVVGVLKLRL